MPKRHTERGFAVYEEGVPAHSCATARVHESSIACEGAHVWITLAGPGAGAGERMEQFDVAGAKRIAAALVEFAAAAEGGLLTEPANPEAPK